MWTLNPDIFLCSDITRSSQVLYLEYCSLNCIQEGNFDACSLANISRRVQGKRMNSDTCRIPVDG